MAEYICESAGFHTTVFPIIAGAAHKFAAIDVKLNGETTNTKPSKGRYSNLFQIPGALGGLYFQWDNLQMMLAKNTHEHTTESFDEKIQSAANVTTDASNLERINRWDCAYEMFKRKPGLGFGPGTYAFEYAAFQDPENLTIISTNFGDMGNAHSEYLGALSETGLVGMLLFMSVVASIFYSAIRLYYQYEEGNDIKILLMGIIVSLSSYFIHAFLNNYLDTDKAAVPVWAMCAMIVAMSIEQKLKDQPTKMD